MLVSVKLFHMYLDKAEDAIIAGDIEKANEYYDKLDELEMSWKGYQSHDSHDKEKCQR